jgi:hypothetical protein
MQRSQARNSADPLKNDGGECELGLYFRREIV